MKAFRFSALALIGAAVSNAALADNTDVYIRNGQIYSHENSFFVSAGAYQGSELYQGVDSKLRPFGNLGYNGKDFNASLANINYRFFGNDKDLFNLSLYLGSPGIALKGSDAAALGGIHERKLSGDLGINLDTQLEFGTLSTSVQHDVTNRYNGFIGQVRYAVPLNLGWGTVVPYAGVSYLSRDFTQYYFGVSKAEANKQHKDYQPGKAFTYNAGYKLIVPLSEHLELSQSSNFNYLDSAIADSPIVDGKQQWNANLALTYYF